MDPATATVAAALITATVAATAATAKMGYTITKDAVGVISDKRHYRKNLKNNREKLERELGKLIALAEDMNKGFVAKEQLKDLSTYEKWEKRAWSLKKEVDALPGEYETTKFHKSRLNKSFKSKCEEVAKHIDEGLKIIKEFV